MQRQQRCVVPWTGDLTPPPSALPVAVLLCCVLCAAWLATQLRSRRTKETKIEAKQRRQAEKAQARK